MYVMYQGMHTAVHAYCETVESRINNILLVHMLDLRKQRNAHTI